MFKRALPLLAVFALVVAAGCGSDGEPTATDDTTDTTAETPETTETTETTVEEEELALDEWVEQADEICAEASDDIDSIEEPEDDEDPEQVVALLEELLELGTAQNDDLEALGSPDEDADLVEEALEILRDRETLIEEAIALVEDDELDEAMGILTEEPPDAERLSEIADELGLEECGGGGSTPDPTTPDTTGTDSPAEYGDDPELDALYDDCADGSADACDELWTASEAGTEYYDFGYSCGGVVPPGESEVCSEVLGGSGEADSYGDDPALDALWDACEDGDGQACDDLFFDSPVDSEYEEFGKTCGGRLEGTDAETEFCADAI